MFRSIAVILSGNIFATLVLMVRNLLIARLISLENFGIASTFLLAVAIVEMFSALGLKQQMVQAKNGDDPQLQAALQFLNVARGVLNAAVLFVLADPLANFFGAPQAVWAYQMIALIPLFLGLVHFDVERLTRQMKFWPTALVNAVPALGSLIAIWPLYHLFDDYRLLLFALMIQSGLTIVMSHMVANRPYQLAVNTQVLMSSLKFGWPLMLNGALMFAVMYGERAIVGGELGMEILALFAMGFSLALVPALVMARSAMSFFLPQLSECAELRRFSALSMTTLQAHILMGNFLLVSVALLGGPFIHVVLSEKYAAAIPLLTWLGIMQALRVWKGGSAVVAISRAHTANPIVTNVMRVMLLPVGWYVLHEGGTLVQLIWIGIAGEFIGFVLGLALTLWRLGLSSRPLLLPVVTSLVLLVIGEFHAQAQETSWLPGVWTSLGLVVMLAVTVLTMADLRSYLSRKTASAQDPE
jgi:O-antigen/teichoic acid export membrane protein